MIIKQFSVYSFGSAAIRAPEYSECLIPNEYFGKIFFVTYTWINLSKNENSPICNSQLGSLTCSGRYAPGPGFLVPSEGSSFLAVIEYWGCLFLYVEGSVTLYVPGPGVWIKNDGG